jgi:hypothetical protein
MPYGDCTLAVGSVYSLDGLGFIHKDPSMHLRSLRKVGIPPRFMMNKQRISVHGMEFNHTVMARQVYHQNIPCGDTTPLGSACGWGFLRGVEVRKQSTA